MKVSKKILFSFGLFALFLTPVLAPAPASATLPLSSTSESTLMDPTSDDAKLLLEDTGMDISEDDDIWLDPNFNEFAQLYVEGIKLIEEDNVADGILLQLDAITISMEINHPAFNESFYATDEEKQSFIDLKDYINENEEEFREDPEGFLIIWALSELAIAFEEAINETPETYIKGYSDPYYDIEPGRIVWLKVMNDDIPNVEAEWEQTSGTEVQWLKTNSKTERAFLAPNVGDTTNLRFAYTITNGEWVLEDFVDVTVEPKYEPEPLDPISSLYINILQRNPDQGGWEYWNDQYLNGMSLYEIENHFYASQEYWDLVS